MLILFGIRFISSCDMELPNDCCYNVQLEYRYQRYGTLESNELGYYISSLREYIFNEHDTLTAINTYKVPHGNGKFYSEFEDFPPGRYTVITLGNKNNFEQISKEDIGITTKHELLLWLDNVKTNMEADITMAAINAHRPPGEMKATEIQGLSDRLYYGYRNFTVEEYGVTRVVVDMTHAHCMLGLTVRWLDKTGHPMADKEYTFALLQTATRYSFMPDKLVYNALEPAVFEPEKEIFPIRDRRRINYIPTVSRNNRTCHAIKGEIIERTLYGEFITFRYCNDSHIILTIFSGVTKIMKEIDLNQFFQEIGINLDYSLCQEYNLIIEIDGDQVRVGLMSVDDWEEGATF